MMPQTAVDPLLSVVLRGLGSHPKTLPPTLFYDAVGSALFDRITTLDDYYVTRAEAEVLAAHGREIAEAAAGGAEAVVMIEPGCGSGAKAAMVLRHLRGRARAYVGLDVSVDALEAGATTLAAAFPEVAVIAVEADYHGPIRLPPLPGGRRVAFFPGSTIGNFDPVEASAFLGRLRDLVGPAGSIVVGVDLWKDPAVLEAAYDDREGVTAAFDKNALAHLNARYDADFVLDRFEHLARVDPELQRVEMHLRSTVDQVFHVAGRRFEIGRGETIHTESSWKYEVGDFVDLAARAGLRTAGVFTDGQRRFGVFVLAASSRQGPVLV